MICLAALAGTRLSPAAQVSISGATAIVGLQVLAGVDQLTVSGILEDDAHHPIAQAPLQVALAGHTAEIRFSACSPAAPGSADPPSDGEQNTALLETDRMGRFCVALDNAAQGAQLRFHYAGTQHLLPTENTLALTPKPNQVLLSFALSPLRIALNRVPLVVQVDTKAAQPAPVRPIAVTLWRTDTGTPLQLGEAVTTVVGQAAFFAVTAEQLGLPGLGELRARFEGDAQSSAYEVVAKLTKTGSVSLALTEPVAVLSGSAAWELKLGATAKPNAPLTGLIEARHGGSIIAVAPLADGQARLRVESSALDAEREVTVSFIANQPWWVAEAPLRVALPATPRNTPRNTYWWAASLLAVAFFVWRAWQRPLLQRPGAHKPTPAANTPQVIVVAKNAAERGWSGRVIDADDERGVPQALVQVQRASFAGQQLVAQTTTDDAGHFTLPEANPAGPVTLQVTATEHRPLEQRLDGPGALLVRIKQRRRALISELVNWASQQGWDAPSPGLARASDPTPGQIARVAQDEGRNAASSWAHSIEDAAFGDSLVDEQRDTTLRQHRPDPTRRS